MSCIEHMINTGAYYITSTSTYSSESVSVYAYAYSYDEWMKLKINK